MVTVIARIRKNDATSPITSSGFLYDGAHTTCRFSLSVSAILHGAERLSRRSIARVANRTGGQANHIDHIIPRACSGAGAPSDMQWLSAADTDANERIERKTVVSNQTR